MVQPVRERDSGYTYEEYLRWSGEDRFELHDGVPVLMTPSPGSRHQSVVGALYAGIRAAVKSKSSPYRIFAAPFDVVLPGAGEIEMSARNVVQPDVMVVCDSEKITPRNCTGAPDLVIEVLSPSTAFADQKYKYELYERAGVGEYWIVDAQSRYLIRYALDASGKYARRGVFTAEDSIPLFFLSDFELNLADVFEGIE